MRLASLVRSLSWASLLLIGASACRPDAYSFTSETSGDTGTTTAPLAPGESIPEQLPKIVGAYEVAIDLGFDYYSYDSGVLVAQQRERLRADGQGEFLLELLFMAGSTGQWRAPTAQQSEAFGRRQYFFTKHRGPALLDMDLARRNYSWRQLDGSFTVAGRSVDRFRLVSLFNLGDVMLDVDQATGVLLAWSYFTAEGLLLTEVKATAVDFQPDLSGVNWPTAMVPTESYDGLGESGRLAFTPLTQIGSGAGFLNSEARMLPLEEAGTGLTNIYLELMSDGVRTVVIAQQETGVSVDQDLPFPARALSFTKLDEGGVTVMQGKLDSKLVFAVGAISSDDLMVLVSTLQSN